MKAVNLIPSDDRVGGVGGVGAGRSQGAAYGVLALLAGLAVLALVYGLARHQVSSRRAQLATVTAHTQQVQSAATALSSYASFDALRAQRVKAVNELVDARFDWAHTLHELGRVMPGGTSISSLTGTIGAATGAAKTTSAAAASTTAGTTGSTSGSSAAAASPVTSATPPGSVPTITLGGCATSQAKVALTLQRLRLIDGVTKVSLQSSAKATRSASGPAGGASEGCGGGAAFSLTLTFQPLPTISATAKAGAELTSSTGGQR
jgi:Tfp pilus assembly protein PilN